MTLEPLILKMISYDHGSPERIQHFLKVHPSFRSRVMSTAQSQNFRNRFFACRCV